MVASAVAIAALFAAPSASAESLCDSSFQNCRTHLVSLIDTEQVEIDVGFWFMTDSTYVSHIIARKNAGVAVRLIVDPRANPTYTGNADSLNSFQSAGIPMVKKVGGGIMHFKMMLFAGQETVEFGSANYGLDEFIPGIAYRQYDSETIFFEDDPAIVDSFKRKFDDLWVDSTNYTAYANVTSRARSYPTYTISADLNLPPVQSFSTRVINLENSETVRLDVDMYRITQQSHSDAIIAAHKRGVPVRYMGEMHEYRNADRLWVAYSMDRMYYAGVPMRVRASAGLNHEKLVLYYGHGIAMFGSSNFTKPSDNYQQEHNYFTTKSWIFQWFEDQFNRKWNNTTGNVETTAFVPQPPTAPVNVSVANGATGVATTGTKLTWYGGPWGIYYDVHLSTESTASTVIAANLNLGPSQTKSQHQSYTLPTLAPHTTYYWRIVSKTAAFQSKSGSVWSFTTGS